MYPRSPFSKSKIVIDGFGLAVPQARSACLRNWADLGSIRYGFQGLEPIFSNFREVFLHSDFPGLVQQISDIRANTFVNFQPTQTFGPVRPHQILRSQETEAPGTALTSSFNFTSLTDGLLRLTADAMPFNFELWDFAQGPLAPTDDRLQQSFHATTFRPLPLLHNEPPIQLSAIEDLLLPDDDLTLQGSASAGASSDTLFDNYRSDDSSDMVLDLDDIPYDEADANQHQRRMGWFLPFLQCSTRQRNH